MSRTDGRPRSARVGRTGARHAAHGPVMAVQAMADPAHRGHLIEDVPALFIIAAFPGWLCPRALEFPLDRGVA